MWTKIYIKQFGIMCNNSLLKKKKYFFKNKQTDTHAEM